MEAEVTKIPILIVALSLALVISACGSSETGPADDPTTTDVAAATTTTQVAASGGESFLDESFPTVEELQAAGDCDELNRMLAGVENENFRVDADRTLAEEEAEAEDEFENTIDPYYEAFSERQADLGCSDAEMMSVLDTASDQRCEAWIDGGHSLDEDPLLMNTANCIDESG
jgi:hypothetical protein